MPPPASAELVSKAIRYAKQSGSAEGACARLRSEGYEVSARAVRKWVAAGPRTLATKPAASAKAPAAPAAKKPSKAAPAAARPAPEPAAPGLPAPAPRSALPPELAAADRLDALGWDALVDLAGDAADFRQAARDEGEPKMYAILVDLELRIHEKIERLRPAPPVDPETDPNNLEAAGNLLRRLETMITGAERELDEAAA